MKHSPLTSPVLTMPPALGARLLAYRALRGFDPVSYLDRKARALGAYAQTANLRSVVIGVSGGVDSALVLAIAARAAVSHDLDVVAAFIPALNDGATGQAEAQTRIAELDAALDTQTLILDMTGTAEAAKVALTAAGAGTPAGWSSGQSVPYLRTALLYTMTSLCSDRGRPGFVLGTNNADEGAYIGYFGKASDGMVDVQMLSDVHKSEVYAAARAAGVPDCVLTVAPTGDMFDGRTDAEVLGASYDFVELHHAVRTGVVDLDGVPSAEAEIYAVAAANLESLHAHNAHKYAVGSPAIHLDLPDLRMQMPDGWKGNLPKEEVFA